MYRLTWRPKNADSTIHTFDSSQELVDWVWNEAGKNWFMVSFRLEQLIDGEWQEPQDPKPQLRNF